MQIKTLVCSLTCLAALASATASAATDPQIEKISKAVQAATGKAPDSVMKSPVNGLWKWSLTSASSIPMPMRAT